jgi:serine/threonine protein kinase
MLNGRYRIMRALGKGGMGTVYMAEHVRLDTIVAVKEVQGPTGDEDESREDLDRCEHEARFLVRLNHPNLPKVTDAFIERDLFANDCFYLVMEYIEGVTLESRLQESPDALAVPQVIEWGLQIADVLGYLHSQDPPIIFRDLKPSNVMVQPDGNIRLIDFGIARRFQPGANKDTSLLGSVGYSPPEQFGRHQTDARSDIYAFAATLHHLLTRRDPVLQPFKFPPARVLNPAVPESLSRLLDTCLAMEPDARPQSIEAVVQGLLAVRDELLSRPLVVAADVNAPATPSGNTGPRIISAKLQQAETQNRRAASREIRSALGPQRPRTPAIAAVLLAIVALAGIAYNQTRSHSSRSVVHPTSALAATSEPVTPVPTSGSQRAAPTEPARDNVAPPPAERSTITAIPGQLLVEQDAYLLPITVRGEIRGHADTRATVAVFFYDVNGSPLLAMDHNSNFANPDGHLSIATVIQVNSDDQTYEQILKVPVRQFPPRALASPIKVRGVIVLDGQSLYSDTVDVTTPLPPDIIENTDGSTDPTGQGQPPLSSGNAPLPGHQPGDSGITGSPR